MHLVDDIDLEPPRHWPVTNPLDDIARVIDTGMACRVDLKNIDMAAGGDRLTRLTTAARLQRRISLAIRADAIQPAGQDTRRRGLADPADTGQHESVRQPAK